MDAVLSKIQELGLPMKTDKPTPSDGNCFYQAILQQCRRPELEVQSKLKGHVILRKRLCEFALSYNFELLEEYKRNYNDVAAQEKLAKKATNDGEDEGETNAWELFFHKMETKGVWAEEPVGQVMASFLERGMVV
jgi:hypothetical protein